MNIKLKLTLFVFSLFSIKSVWADGFTIKWPDTPISTHHTVNGIPTQTKHYISISPEISLTIVGAILTGYAAYGMASCDDEHQERFRYARNTGIIMFVSGFTIPLAKRAINNYVYNS